MSFGTVIKALATLALVVSLSQAHGQGKDKGNKMYKWTDQQGNVHYSDHIPPEAKEYARERLSDQGVAVEQTNRAQTPEEIAAQIAAEEKAASEARTAEEQRRADEALLNSYASEEDITRAYNQRIDLLDQTVEARHIEIGAREQGLSKLVAQAAEMERSGSTVSDALKQMIAGERTEIERQKEYLAKKEGEKAAAKAEYDRDMARYRAAMARATKGE